jgi:hypothetical protein
VAVALRARSDGKSPGFPLRYTRFVPHSGQRTGLARRSYPQTGQVRNRTAASRSAAARSVKFSMTVPIAPAMNRRIGNQVNPRTNIRAKLSGHDRKAARCRREREVRILIGTPTYPVRRGVEPDRLDTGNGDIQHSCHRLVAGLRAAGGGPCDAPLGRPRQA